MSGLEADLTNTNSLNLSVGSTVEMVPRVGNTGPTGATGAVGPAGGPIPVGGTAGDYPSPDGVGGYEWIDPTATFVSRPTTDLGDWALLRRDTTDVTKGVSWTTAELAIAKGLGWLVATDAQYAGGADETAATSSAAAVDALITAVNATTGYKTIWFPAGTFDLTAGLSGQITKPHVYIKGAGTGLTTFRVNTGTLFSWGDGVVSAVSGGGCSEATLTAIIAPDSASRCFDVLNGIGQRFENLMVDNIRQLVRLGSTAGSTANVIAMRNIRGETDSAAGSVVIDVVKGAGLIATDLTLSAKGVGYPTDATSAHPANTTTLIRFGQQSWDTASFRNIFGNRYNIGLDIDVQANMVVGNLWFDAFIMDYCKTNGIHLKTGTNANLRTLNFKAAYAVATDSHSVLVEAPAGYMRHVTFDKCEARQAGKNNWRFTGTEMKDVVLNNCYGVAANRLDATNVGSEHDDVVVLANGVTIQGGHYGEPGTSDWVSYVAASRYGINVGADLDTRVLDVTSEGTSGGFVLNANTVSSRKRLVTRNRRASGALPDYASTAAITAPATTALQTHLAATIDTLHIYGGTVTAIFLNGIQIGTTGPASFTVRPGDNWSITHAVAPTVVRAIAS